MLSNTPYANESHKCVMKVEIGTEYTKSRTCKSNHGSISSQPAGTLCQPGRCTRSYAVLHASRRLARHTYRTVRSSEAAAKTGAATVERLLLRWR
eukprot:scaffold72166_cov52-Prasinocladus_malaysianus.AAC.2